jgi:hypothetical protein
VVVVIVVVLVSGRETRRAAAPKIGANAAKGERLVIA